ncbi:MAG: hypothetical protein RIC80_22330 [Cyclobacteriaceae bacterium]
MKSPNGSSGLDGYTEEKEYTGRAFNGFFEVSPKWGSGHSTKLIDKGTFFKYFDLISDNANGDSDKKPRKENVMA